MFSKIKQTAFPPATKPIMVWDGECSFCKFWITNWKSKTDERIDYRTLLEVAGQFEDIPLKEFKKASRLIEPNGSVYSGPDSAYRSFLYSNNNNFSWHKWYSGNNIFTFLSDHTYNFIAKNRSFMFALTKLFFGKNPESLKPYWLILILMVCIIVYLLLKFL